MSNNTDRPDRRVLARRLRVDTETQLIGNNSRFHSPLSYEDVSKLHLHQLELVMQNNELRRTQLELEVSQAHYVELYHFAPVGYLTLTITGMIAEANLRGANLLGAERLRLIHQRFDKFIADTDKDRWHRLCLQAKHQGGKQQCELLLHRADGHHFYAQIDYLYLQQVNVDPLMRIAVTDITESIHSKQALIENWDRLSFAFKGSGDGLWDWNVLTGEVYYSPQWKALLGFADNEITDDFKEWEQRIHPEDLPAVMASIRDYLSSASEIYANEHRLLCKDGRYKWILTRGTAQTRSPDGTPTRMVGTHTDVTQHRQTEQELLISAAAFETQNGTIVADANKIILRVNRAFLRMTGYSNEDLVGQPLSVLRSGNHADDYYQAMWASIDANGFWQREILEKRKNGEFFPAWLTVTVIHDANGNIGHYVGSFIDITERKQAEENLLIAAAAFESQNGIIVTNANNIILRVNQAFCRITGYCAEEVIAQHNSMLRSGQHDEDFYQAAAASISKTGYWQGEMWGKQKDGRLFPTWHTITAITSVDGNISHYVGSFIDITEQKAAAEQIERLAYYDPLTHRRLLKDRLSQALATSARYQRQGALLFIDLDHFKTLNDTLGHDMGDRLLQQVAQRLVANLREIDTAARLGGDEFVVMLEDLSEHSVGAIQYVEIVGSKILASLNEPYPLAGHDYRCTASIGVTLFDGHLVAEEELLKHVDIAMYQAKQRGRNALCFFDQAMQSALTERVALEADLRLALERDQLTLHYQMQTTHDGQVVGAELLVRWQHPVHGLMPPTGFVPLAEETGLILTIGQWVLESACHQLKQWENNNQTRHLHLAVNVSTHQLHQADFLAQTKAILAKFPINPNRLKLEFTESAMFSDIDDAIDKMQALKALGLSLSIDDFGTGYSSLSYLTILPLDQLKIDQSFIHNIGIKKADALIVQTIIGMAHSLGIEVIAEGVETEAQRAFLEQQGCFLCQGYLFSQPLPLAEFETLL